MLFKFLVANVCVEDLIKTETYLKKKEKKTIVRKKYVYSACIEKKFACKYTHTVQTHVFQGSLNLT